MILRAPKVIDEQEFDAVDEARTWARKVYRAAMVQPALGTPWQAYCRAFDHELWLQLARIRGVWT